MAGKSGKLAFIAKKPEEAVTECSEAYALTAIGYFAGGWFKKSLPVFDKTEKLGFREKSFVPIHLKKTLRD